MRLKTIMAGLLAAAAVAAPATAATNFTSNFDDVSFSGDSAVFETVDGWTSATLGIRVRTGTSFGTAFSSPNFVELDTEANSSMSRLIDAGSYTLTYLYSPRPGNAEGSNGVAVLLGGDFVDGWDADGVDLEDTDWSQLSYSFTVLSPTELTFAAFGTSDTMGGYIDNIQLVAAPVPEAGEWAMIVAGLGVVGAAARRRRTA